jgi:multicomponent K+:H+ antiporter subunit E
MRRLFPHPHLTLVLVIIWLALVNSLALGHVLLGLFLGWAIVWCTRGFLLNVPHLRRPLRFTLFVSMVFYDIVMANLHVARLVLGRQDRLRPAFVEVPMGIEDEFLLSLLACIISLTPGTVSAGLSADHKTLLLHVLDLEDQDALIAEIKSRYEAPLLEMFECSPT